MAELKFGTVDGKVNEIYTKGAFQASQVLPAKSGRFVTYDVSDASWISCENDEATIGGYVEESLTTSATKGATSLGIISVRQRVFKLPYAAAGAAATLTAAVAITLVGKLIDLYVDGNGVQYADNAASQAILRVEGHDVDNNALLVSVIDSAIVQQS